MIERVRKDIKRFSNTLIDDLAGGSACVVLGWSGDINQAAERALEAKSKDVIEVLFPSTGGLIFFDTMAIPATAKHPGNAHRFINFMLRPENAAAITNQMRYPTGNTASESLLNKTIGQNPSILVSKSNISKMVPPDSLQNVARASIIAHYMDVAYGLKIVAKK